MEIKKEVTKKITLVNRTNLSSKGKKSQNVKISGLGKIEAPKYRYNDICPNGMK